MTFENSITVRVRTQLLWWSKTAVVTVFILIAVLWVIGSTKAMNFTFTGSPFDGTFQLFNPLRRIAAGQTPGRDFQFFHGLGVPLLHYPGFVWLGEDLRAAELTRIALSPMLFWVGGVLSLRALRMQWWAAIGIATGLLIAAGPLRLGALRDADNSLLGVRSFVPTIFASIFATLEHTSKKLLWFALAIVAGFALFCGTEHGLAVIVATSALIVVGALSDSPIALRVALAFAFVCGAGATWTVLLAIVTRAQPLDAIRYAIAEVPRDQFWYFGVHPNAVIRSWSQFLDTPIVLFALLAGVGMSAFCVYIALRRTAGLAALARVQAILSLYGLVATVAYLGIASPAYIAPLLRVEIFGLIVFATLGVKRSLAPRLPFAAEAAPALVIASLACASPFVAVLLDAFLVRPHTDRVMGMTLSPTWSSVRTDILPMLQSADAQSKGTTLWSTYAGFFEAELGIFHPSIDYLIHALGDSNRARYASDFAEAQPRFVQTIYNASFAYEPWLQNQNWSFYETLLLNYHPVRVSQHVLLWERDSQTWIGTNDTPTVGISLESGTEIRIPRPANASAGLATATLHYQVRNPWRRLPIVGQLPRIYVAKNGTRETQPVSLPPAQGSWTFPIFFDGNEDARLRIIVESLMPGVEVDVLELQVRACPVSRDTTMALLGQLGSSWSTPASMDSPASVE